MVPGGKSQHSTGFLFFDHMLDQLARHGSTDLEIKVNGDLHIDEHHLPLRIQDWPWVKHILKAWEIRKGIYRYGFSITHG